MRIDKQTRQQMADAIAPFDTPDRRDRYRRGDVQRIDKVKDLNERYRWDLFWDSEVWRILPADVTGNHIDTALRRIVKPL